MQTSPAGRATCESFEGFDKEIPGRPGFVITYYDSVGVLTLGFGHTNLGGVPPRIKPGDIWSRAQADAGLSADLVATEREVERIMAGVNLAQGEFDALVLFHFNTGDLGKSSIPSKIRAGDKAAAMATLLEYCHAGGKELAGLVRRRHAEKLLFEGKTDEALKLAGAHVAEGAGPLPKATRPAPVPPAPVVLKAPPAVAPVAPAPQPASPWWLAVLKAILGALFRRS